MSEEHTAHYTSERKTRNGNMAFVVKLSNLFKTQQDAASLKELEGHHKVFNEAWNKFVQG